MRASETGPAGAGKSEDRASSGAGTLATVAAEPTPVVEEPMPVDEEPMPVVEEPMPEVEEPAVVVEEPTPVAGASIVVTDAQPSVVGLSHLSTDRPSAAADVWRVARGVCAITSQAAIERFPQVGRLAGEMKQIPLRRLRRSPQARIEAWSALTALLR
jgi:hypothetical protein